MTTRECPKATMVEALRDGRLGPQELASMERHVAVCAACSQLARDLDLIGDAVREPIPPSTPLEHQRARFALLRRATTPVGSPIDVDRAARSSLSLAALLTPSRLRFALAASFTAFAFVFGWIARSSAPSALSTAVGAPVASSLARGSVALGQDVILRSSSDAHFERSHQAGLDLVKLEDGALDLTLPPRAGGDRFVVRTRDAEIDVRATAFRVEAQQGRIRGVAVTEGSVEVRYAGFSAVITTGGSWHATDDVAAAVDDGSRAPKPALAVAKAAPTEPAAGAATVVAARATPIASIAAGGSKAASAGARSLRASSASASAAAASAASRKAAPAPTTLTAVASAARPGPSAASRDFAAAMRSLGRGDYDRAADLLSAFSAAHPGDARSDEADYLRAIALQRRGQAAEAAAIAKRYLETRTAGAHRAEAMAIASE